jgi:5,10-methylenetetrahydrofolate reductase
LGTQLTFSAEELIRWRSSCDFAGPVLGGVMVVSSASMARGSAEVPQLAIPESIVSQLTKTGDFGKRA